MIDTNTLIAQLSREPIARSTPLSPAHWGAWLVAGLAVYAACAQLYLGVRPDVLLQLTRPAFVAELGLLLVVVFSGAVACVIAMYPDAYQKPALLLLPSGAAGALLLLLALQFSAVPDVRMVLPLPGSHSMQCVICIGSVALLPAAVIFAVLRKGACVRPLQAGFLAVLTASAVGCLALRLAEPNDAMAHIVVWHYLPTLAFALAGAVIGRGLLKW